MAADTIFGLATAASVSGVAVVRVSGPRALEVCRALAGRQPKPRYASYCALRDSMGNEIDQALVIAFHAPNSFTGEDVVEFQVHGSIAIIRALLAELEQMSGLRPAAAGEFTQRAFINGKLDLVQVEALGDLLASETRVQAQALRSVSERLRGEIEDWRTELLAVSAVFVAHLDFSDERDVPEALDSDVERRLSTLATALRAAADSMVDGAILQRGIRVAVLGPPNAGKSSLVNRLVRKDVSITSPVAGTTRDLIEVGLSQEGLPFVLVDTAGIRETADSIEAEGIRRAVKVGRDADIVFWLDEWARDDGVPSFDDALIRIRTKCDIDQGSPAPGWIDVSSVTGEGLPVVLRVLREYGQACFQRGAGAVVLHPRQADAINRAASALHEAASAAKQAPELAAEGVRVAIQALDELTGRIATEEILGEVFSRFCIGK